MRYQWAVIGAGPAGIATVGKLLDQGIPGNKIAWIDPDFNAGDLGKKWGNVSSNTTVALFHRFFEVVKAFNYSSWRNTFALEQQEPKATCELHLVADALKHVTLHLQQSVKAFSTHVNALQQGNRCWTLECTEQTISSENVVLAIGAEPKYLANLPVDKTIPTEIALDATTLKQAYDPNETVGVFGSSHSAIIIIRYLVEQGAKKIINFYQSPLKFAVPQGDWILFDNTGLKGTTAQWARDHLLGELPSSLTRVLSQPESLAQHLPQCDKLIQTVGFQPRQLPVEGMAKIHYSDTTGIIAPGLFGIGIAFPEASTDPAGNFEYRVGMWKFMDYLERILPFWLQYKL